MASPLQQVTDTDIFVSFPVDPVPSTTAETIPVSRPLAFTVTMVTSPGPAPASIAPVLPSSNSLLDSLKKMQSSQAAPVPAGEEK